MINKILIIEDELELAIILQRFLSKKNFHVDTTASLRDGFKKLFAEPFDALILDNNLPDGKGIDYITDFRNIYPDIVIVAISALQMRDAALLAGANFFVEKPISLHGIHSVLAA